MKKFISPTLIILCTIVIGFVLRVWGINWGLPLKYAHIDESSVIFYAFKFFSGDFNPHVFFDYPTLFLYIIFFVWSIYYAIGTLFGTFVSLDQFVGKYVSGNISDIYLLARMVSVLFATGTIYLVYKTAKILYSEKVAVLASIFMCLSWLHIMHSHYATADTTALFMTGLFVYFALKYYISENPKHLLISCFVLGLATATKYYPLIFSLNLLLIPILKQQKLSKQTVGWYILGFVLIISGFLLGCPYALLDFTAFSARFTTIFSNVILPHKFDFCANVFTVVKHLLEGNGLIFFVLFIISLLFYFKTRTETFIFSFFIIFFGFVLNWKTIAPYYLFPLYPFMFIITAKGLENITKKYHPRIFVVITIALIISVLPKIIYTDYVLTQKDIRIIAHSWITKNVPPKSKILRFPYTTEFKPDEDYAVKVDWNYKIPQSEYKQFDYIIASSDIIPPTSDFKLIQSFSGVTLSGFHNPKVNIYKKCLQGGNNANKQFFHY